MIPIVLHIPHSSRYIPECERGQLLLNDEVLEQELKLPIISMMNSFVMQPGIPLIKVMANRLAQNYNKAGF